MFRSFFICFLFVTDLVIQSSLAAQSTEKNPLKSYGLKTTVADVRKLLRGFSPSKEQIEEIRVLIKQLNAPSFRERHKATKALTELSVLPHQLIEEAMNSKDSELRSRARLVMENRSASIDRKQLRAAFLAIQSAKLKGLTTEVLQTMSQLNQDVDWRHAVNTLMTTASMKDVAALQEALKNDSPIVRASAVWTIQKIKGKAAINYIKPLLKDTESKVQLATARALSDLGERSSLQILVNLLASEKWQIRRESSLALRALTKQKFDYSATAHKKVRKVAIEKWQAWVAKNSDTAKLHFPIKISVELNLFKDSDLSAWDVFIYNKIHDGSNDRKTCIFEKNGVITVTTKRRGYLRTKRTFKNYRLELDYRWPKSTTFADSGVNLFQSADNVYEPSALEVQLNIGHAGDFHNNGGFNTKGRIIKTGIGTKLANSSEKPSGSWNRLVIEVQNGDVMVKVNGVLQNKASGCPKTPARIGFRLEHYSFQLRNVLVTLLDK